MQVLYFDPDKGRARQFLLKFDNAIHAATPQEAIEMLGGIHFDSVCIYQYENVTLCDIEDRHKREDSDNLIDWIAVNLPVLKTVLLHGQDFKTIARYRATLNALGYKAAYMPLNNMLELERL